ncbi:hypothetical protein GX51_06573 [Blastomyces parvus]|uniref:Uncharacterized protein n=1 Tax=Blastomyces parvus TaxID=2060905 RepID=A0A2B7WQI0_9EURO|nr:hypothetical protein GX51_06573 [Blastomyces parvus]
MSENLIGASPLDYAQILAWRSFHQAKVVSTLGSMKEYLEDGTAPIPSPLPNDMIFF